MAKTVILFELECELNVPFNAELTAEELNYSFGKEIEVGLQADRVIRDGFTLKVKEVK